MFCRNCGKELPPNADVCLNCGFAKDKGAMYCQNCGEPVNPGASICVRCGSALNNESEQSSKSRIVAGILAILLGSLGIHNFYLGFTTRAVVQLLITILGGLFTCGVASVAVEIWAVVEGILLLTNKNSVDAEGKILQG